MTWSTTPTMTGSSGSTVTTGAGRVTDGRGNPVEPALMDATALLQDWLDRMGDATLRGDWARLSPGTCRLPFRLRHRDRRHHRGDRGRTASAGFDGFVAALRSQRVSDYIRLVTVGDSSRGDQARRHLCHPCARRKACACCRRFESAITLQRDGTDLARHDRSPTPSTTTAGPSTLPGVTPRL